MANRIPVLTPNDAALFLKYFSGVDEAISKRFSLGFSPDEEHITSLLCEMLDNKGAKLHNLTYGIDALNSDLEKNGSLIRAALTIKTTAYNKHQERYFTQSDIGLIIEYNDRIDRRASFKKGILLQAKRLFPLSDDIYGLDSKYQSFDEQQHSRLTGLVKSMSSLEKNADVEHRIIDLDEHAGDADCARYLLYNPPFSSFIKRQQELIIHQQLKREASSIFDYTSGLHVYKDLLESGGASTYLATGCLLVPLNTIHSIATKNGSGSPRKASAFTLGDTLKQSDVRKHSLPWFVVFDLLLGRGGCVSDDVISFIGGTPSAISREFQIAPPRYVFTITVTAGSAEQ